MYIYKYLAYNGPLNPGTLFSHISVSPQSGGNDLQSLTHTEAMVDHIRKPTLY